MRKKEIHELTTESIITNVFYYGVWLCNDGGTKQAEKELSWHCEELANRGVVEDGESLYKSMCK